MFSFSKIKPVKYAGCFFFLIQAITQAQEDSSFKFRINVNAGLIINSAFSNIPKTSQPTDEFTTEKYSPLSNGKKTRTGFFTGVDFLFFPKEKLKGVAGISFVRAFSSHHYTYDSEGPTNKPGFTKLRTLINEDAEEAMSSINLSAGIRNQLYKNLFLTSSLVLNSPLVITRTINGQTETFYSNNSGGSDYNVTYVKDEQRKSKRTDQSLCIRFNLEYQFELGGSLARVFIFRNLGMVYTLPWWCIGVSYSVKK